MAVGVFMSSHARRRARRRASVPRPGRPGPMVLGPPPDAMDRAAAANVRHVSDGLDELYQVSQAVLSVTRQMSVRDVLQVIVRSARSLVGARYAGARRARRGRLVRRVRGGRDQRGRVAGDRPAAAPARDARRAAQRGQAGTPRRYPRRPEVRGLAGRPPADVALPRRAGAGRATSVLGIIFAANKASAAAAGRGFTERDEEILSLFAAHAAIALTNARLYERSRELSVMQERSRLARDLHDAVTAEAVQHQGARARRRGRWRPGTRWTRPGSGPRSTWSARSAPRRTPSCAR